MIISPLPPPFYSVRFFCVLLGAVWRLRPVSLITHCTPYANTIERIASLMTSLRSLDITVYDGMTFAPLMACPRLSSLGFNGSPLGSSVSVLTALRHLRFDVSVGGPA